MRPTVVLLLLSLSSCVTYRRSSLSSDYEERLPPEASMNGRYRDLLFTFEAPEDAGKYGRHFDWGWWDFTHYKGYGPLTPGYWVYLEPNWYVWERQNNNGPQTN